MAVATLETLVRPQFVVGEHLGDCPCQNRHAKPMVDVLICHGWAGQMPRPHSITCRERGDFGVTGHDWLSRRFGV